VGRSSRRSAGAARSQRVMPTAAAASAIVALSQRWNVSMASATPVSGL